MSRAAGPLTICLVLLTLTAARAADAEAPLRIYATIAPVQYLVARVAGAGVETGTVVRAGQRPETYEPSPRQIARLAKADVIFGVGLPLEQAWRRQIHGAAEQGPEWIDLSAGLAGTESGESADGAAPEHQNGQEHGHGHGGGRDPHVWLNPLNARHMAGVISEVLGRLRPGDAERYAANAEALRGDLDGLHREIMSILQPSRVDVFLVFHPAWGHFARTYGLEQLAIEREGKEPGPRSLAGIIDEARDAGIRTVFVDPQQSTRLAETVARAIGGEIATLDPLAPDYLANLRRVAHAIAESGS